jgi:heme-degrading monooxygenase HmoA|tara:strand:- start:95 stop:298 length:204 start_codon:yes stop_codon:yes gene_type:complete
MSGLLPLQYLKGEDGFVAITTWSSQDGMEAYADSALIREIYENLKPHLQDGPTVHSYTVKTNINTMW